MVEDEYWVGGDDPRRGGAVGPGEDSECMKDDMAPTASPNEGNVTNSSPTVSPSATNAPAGDDKKSGAISVVGTSMLAMVLLSAASAFVLA